MSNNQLLLPVQGMTCASCVGHVERALNKVKNVASANVNLATEKANVVFTNSELDVLDLVQAVQDSGYEISVEKMILPIGGMTCVSCVAHVEGALGDVLGVVEVNVNLATEKANVSFVPGVASLQDFNQAVAKIGYEVLETSAETKTESTA